MERSSPAGIWYLLANASRLELSIQFHNNRYSGNIKNEGGAPEPLDQISWDPASRWLEFCRLDPGFFQWYRICMTYGIMAGRLSHASVADKPVLTAYVYHVTGWSPNWVDVDIVPRTWNVTIDTIFKGVLRIDRDASNVLRGCLRVFDNSAIPVCRRGRRMTSRRSHGTANTSHSPVAQGLSKYTRG
jgi:hypothetical protein